MQTTTRVSADEARNHPTVLRAIEYLRDEPASRSLSGRLDGFGERFELAKGLPGIFRLSIGGEELEWRPAEPEATARYVVKCDDCKRDLRETDSLQESAAGGRCESCRETDEAERLAALAEGGYCH